MSENPEVHVYESDPGPLALAEYQVDLEARAEVHLRRLARRLLALPEINPARIGQELPVTSSGDDEVSLERFVSEAAPHGLRLFDAGYDAALTFKVAPAQAAPFLRSLLGVVSEEVARRDLSQNGALYRQEAFAADVTGYLEEQPDEYGIFSVRTEGNLYELASEESAVTHRARAESLLSELSLILCKHAAGSEQKLADAEKLRDWAAELIQATFETEEPRLYRPIFQSVDETFDQFASDVSEGGRQAYTGIIMTLAGLTHGSLDHEAARARVRKGVARG